MAALYTYQRASNTIRRIFHRPTILQKIALPRHSEMVILWLKNALYIYIIYYMYIVFF